MHSPEFTVSIHVRRADVTPEEWPDLWIGWEQHARIVARVKAVLGKLGIAARFCVFSQGDPSEVAKLGLPEAEVHMDGDPLRALERMIASDLLVTTASSFSFLAGLICEGAVLCRRFDMQMADWVVCDDAGDFDAEALERRIADVLAKRAGGR